MTEEPRPGPADVAVLDEPGAPAAPGPGDGPATSEPRRRLRELTGRPGPALGVAAAILLVLAGDLVALQLYPRSTPPDPEPAMQAFLDRYVDPDGRVVRLDEGGDTVSEGQVYGLLVALAAGDEAHFSRVWSWTAEHLQRDDGLLASRWEAGEVTDASPASDADMQGAFALLLAADRFEAPRFAEEGRRLADAVLAHETVPYEGRPVLAAGPWATDHDPPVINPSYLWPRAAHELAGATGDDRWEAVGASSSAVLSALLGEPPHLPPNWATLPSDGPPEAAPDPAEPDAQPRFGLDAARALVWLADSCRAGDRELAGAAWEHLRDRDDDVATVQALDGEPLVDWSHPATLVATAATADAAGDAQARDALLERADELNREHPSYYGAAWVALGSTLLVTDELGGCG